VDLNGDQGLSFFSAPSVLIAQDTNIGGSLSVAYAADISQLTTSDYVLTTDGTNANYSITRLSDKTIVSSGSVSSSPITVDGLEIDLSLTAANGEYRIRPTRDGAANFSLKMSDPRDVAIGMPVVNTAASSNTGTASLTELSVSAYDGNTLSATTLTYDSANNRYNLSGGATGPVPYVATESGKTVNLTITNFGEVSFVLNGQPNDGDTFVLSDNAGSNYGVGDNRNALALSNIQTTQTMSGGTANFQDVYGQIVADVGRRTKSAEVNGAAQQGFLNQAIAAKDAVSGVNLDEEAASLVRYQQAYQAASQVVLTSRTIFDTLLGAFR